MRAIGSCACRRTASAAMASASAGASTRPDCAISAVWSSPSTWPTMMRASSAGASMFCSPNSRARRRRATSTERPASVAGRADIVSADVASGFVRFTDLAQRLAFDHLRQLVQREINAVIAHAPLRKIIGADAFGAVAGADLTATLGGARRILPLPLVVVQPGTQDRHRLGTIPVLRTVLLHHDDDAGGEMGHAHGRLGLVDVLATGAP